MPNHPPSKAGNLHNGALSLHTKIRDEQNLSDLLPACALLVAILIILSAVYVSTAAGKGEYVVVTPPAWSPARAINLVISADGRFMGTGIVPNMLFVSSDRADFRPRLRAAGAWLVMPVPVRPGCYGSFADGRSA